LFPEEKQSETIRNNQKQSETIRNNQAHLKSSILTALACLLLFLRSKNKRRRDTKTVTDAPA